MNRVTNQGCLSAGFWEIRARLPVKMQCVSAAQHVLWTEEKREEMSWSVSSNNNARLLKTGFPEMKMCGQVIPDGRALSGGAWSGMGGGRGEGRSPPECALGTRPLPAGESGVNLACVLAPRHTFNPFTTVCPPCLSPSCPHSGGSTRTWRPIKGITVLVVRSKLTLSRGLTKQPQGPLRPQCCSGPTTRPWSLRSKLAMWWRRLLSTSAMLVSAC